MSGRRVTLLQRVEAATIFTVARKPFHALALMALGVGALVRLAFDAAFLVLWGISVW